MPFAHLHVHTEYSLLDGSNKITDYVNRVKELGQTHAAITDHGVMYGVIEFYRAAQKQGITPIIGCEVYVAPGSRFDKEFSDDEERYNHLVLLAESNVGYSNLVKLVSIGFTEGKYHRPRVDMEVLCKHHEGIIALSACLYGEVQRYIQKGLIEEAEKAACRYRDCFGAGNFYLELQDHGLSEQKAVNTALLAMSQKLDIPLVATNDVHYTDREDEVAHDILLCIQTGKTVDDVDRMRFTGGQFYVKSEEEMRSLFPYALEAVENTQKIADRCHVEIEFGVPKLPTYEVPDGYDAETYLRELCQKGLHNRHKQKNEAIQSRLNFEIDTIVSMGFVDYFLIVWDYVNYARDHGIMVGPGRGSAAGSLVSYCLYITNVDPIRYNLLFERFLNPERISMPDIDVDFDQRRRDEVIDYISQKYGRDHVVQIGTLNRMKAKGAIRDVARALGFPYAFGDSLAKMIPGELNITLERALELNAELRQLCETDEQAKYLMAMARRLEGLPRNASTHASGVVITTQPTDEFVPLAWGKEDGINTQYDMTTLEQLGLLKMDILGLTNLTILQDAIQIVAKSQGKVIDLDQLDFGDGATYADIGLARTEGVFQLESAGMKSFMKELKPQNLEDIIAGIALYRPGPMEFIPKYLQGRHAKKAIAYACPQLEPILSPTYGCIVYQEQVMQIVRDLAGYTLGRSDLMRRAMSKKKADVMLKERENFVYGNAAEGVPGCVARGIPENSALQIYDDMMDFALYAFNKSHAASYAVVSYQTAYLKHHYPVEYMAALMTSAIGSKSKVAAYIMACRGMGITLLPPDINMGEASFSVINQCILYALTAIKGVGYPVIEALVNERAERGEFTNIQDFIVRMSDSGMNKSAVEYFIKAGALDSLPGTRKQFMAAYKQIADDVHHNKKAAMSGQMTLLDLAGDEEKTEFELRLPEVGEYDKEMILEFEKEVLGVYLSGHPLEKDEELWRAVITNTSADFYLDAESGTTAVQDREAAVIGGIIAEMKTKYTKANKLMAYLQVEDMAGVCEVIVFPNDYEKYGKDLAENNRVFVRGRVSLEEDKDGKLICEKICGFSDVRQTLWVKFANKAAYEASCPWMYELFALSPGNDSVVIYLDDEKQTKNLPPEMNVGIDEALLEGLRDSFGAGNVKVTWDGL